MSKFLKELEKRKEKKEKEEKQEQEVRNTEVYRAIYLFLSGKTVRGSKEKAIRKCLEELKKHKRAISN